MTVRGKKWQNWP